MHYLKIENPGICPTELFSVLGASMSRDNGNSQTIGQFGSGSKLGVLACMRHKLNPTIFCGNLSLQFDVKPMNVKDQLNTQEFNRICIKYGGKDENNVSRSGTEDLGYVLEYGAADWTTASLGLREFVSNAIDYSVRLLGENGWKKVVVELVPENKVRAKAGHTRVFIPVNDEVLNFANNIGRWFLHFSEPENLNKQILPKNNRNMGSHKSAVIYRRGVLVREISESANPSLFDYNFQNLKLDECRKADDWTLTHQAGLAIKNADKDSIKIFLASFAENNDSDSGLFWEHTLGQYSLSSTYDCNKNEIRKNWKQAFEELGRADSVMCSSAGKLAIARKGKKPMIVPEGIMKAATGYDLPTEENELDYHEKEGKDVFGANSDAQGAIDFLWDITCDYDLAMGRPKPAVMCFRELNITSNNPSQISYLKDDTIYINADNVGVGTETAGWEALNNQLLMSVLEQFGKYIVNTTTTDSLEYHKWLRNFVIRLAKTSKQMVY